MAVIRPFALADIFLVQRLQRSGVPLAIENILTHPRPPLWLAMSAPWPWAGVGVATYVFRDNNSDGPLAGFVQMLKRASRPEADLLHLAPALSPEQTGDSNREPIWRKLLMHCCTEAAHHGLARLFASVPNSGREQSFLSEAGFRLYTRETIYRLAKVPTWACAAGTGPSTGATDRAPAGFRNQRPQDSWALQRLYSRSTPHLVQQAEGAMTGPAGSPPLSWWEPGRLQRVVWAPAGEVRGAVQAHVGRAGHWIRIWGANSLIAREVRALTEQGLQLLASGHRSGMGRPLPVYATVRDYETGLSGALTGFGFAPFADRARFVRHTMSACREGIRVALPALEARTEAPRATGRLWVQTQSTTEPQSCAVRRSHVEFVRNDQHAARG